MNNKRTSFLVSLCLYFITINHTTTCMEQVDYADGNLRKIGKKIVEKNNATCYQVLVALKKNDFQTASSYLEKQPHIVPGLLKKICVPTTTSLSCQQAFFCALYGIESTYIKNDDIRIKKLLEHAQKKIPQALIASAGYLQKGKYGFIKNSQESIRLLKQAYTHKDKFESSDFITMYAILAEISAKESDPELLDILCDLYINDTKQMNQEIIKNLVILIINAGNSLCMENTSSYLTIQQAQKCGKLICELYLTKNDAQTTKALRNLALTFWLRWFAQAQFHQSSTQAQIIEGLENTIALHKQVPLFYSHKEFEQACRELAVHRENNNI